MQTYYQSLAAIEQQTMQLDHVMCAHCHRRHQLVSHGFIYKKRKGHKLEAVGKRVFCSNRRRHVGCGRTMQLYLDSIVRYLHFAGETVVAFVLALMANATIAAAYRQATGNTDTRNAYRWLQRLHAQLSDYRSLSHQAPLPEIAPADVHHPPTRRVLLGATFTVLLQQYGQTLCSVYQLRWQRPFLAMLP